MFLVFTTACVQICSQRFCWNRRNSHYSGALYGRFAVQKHRRRFSTLVLARLAANDLSHEPTSNASWLLVPASLLVLIPSSPARPRTADSDSFKRAMQITQPPRRRLRPERERLRRKGVADLGLKPTLYFVLTISILDAVGVRNDSRPSMIEGRECAELIA